LRNPIAIPALIRCLGGHAGVWSKKPLFDENVRVRAVSAMATFLSDPKIQAALQAANHDPSPLVRQTAEQVLRRSLPLAS